MFNEPVERITSITAKKGNEIYIYEAKTRMLGAKAMDVSFNEKYEDETFSITSTDIKDIEYEAKRIINDLHPGVTIEVLHSRVSIKKPVLCPDKI